MEHMAIYVMKKYLAECVGTFGLTLAVLVSLSGSGAVPTPVIAALTLCLFVYSIGHISGAHLNPAVTVGLFSLGNISFKDAVAYIVSQVLGAIAAMYIGGAMAHGAAVLALNTPAVFFAECIGMFFFAFGIASVVRGKVPTQLSGIVVGLSLLLGISLASVLSNGVLNPAVALGIGSFSWAYLFGPIAGSMLGMWVFMFVAGEKRQA